ncbi:MAG TPA: SdiA-regulated domain-containing protein [Rubricoccaceae bacterium]|jgi:uncharacterized protein YjiK|nr:SdiA-regulated domain-containing protein [Rubricoccaceae bacterium]
MPRRLLLPLALLAACAGDRAADSPPPAQARADSAAAAVPYRLGRPDVAFALPPALAGVSGLTPLGPDRLGAVQDGDGVLFVLDPRTGTIVSRHPFGNSGDYVGVEAVGDTVWVLQDNGTLHEIAGATGAGPARRQHATPLRSRCDPEGLGYEPASHRLLIACKAEAGPELAGVRVIYAFDLRKKRLSGRPAILFDRRPLDAHGTSFKPSALAVHPRTEQIYVLSAGRRALAVLDPDGRLAAAVALPSGRYPRPEGMAFLPDGTLFIANEGDGGVATLLRFAETTP